MAIAVVLIVIAVVLAASVRWWRHAQGDQRSVEAYHTLINRLQQIDAQNHGDERIPVDEPRPTPKPAPPGPPPTGPTTPQIRIVPTRAPSGRPSWGGRRSGPDPSGPAGGAGGSQDSQGSEGSEDADWGPPVRLVPHPRPEPVPAPVARPASRPAQSAPTVGPTAAPPVDPSRPVMFFDDFATRARRPKPAPAVIAIRAGDRPWLWTARQYAVPVSVGLLAVVISLGSLAVVSSSGSGGTRKVVSSRHPHGAAAPAPASSVSVAPASPSTSPSSSSSVSPAPAATSPTGAPQLSVVSPASGVPGQEVTLAGAGLFSSDGLIVVRFGATQATVDCPNQTTCQAIVPNAPPGSAATGAQMITVSTGAGTSNPLKFTYTS